MINDEINSGERLFAPKNKAFSVIFGIIVTLLVSYIVFLMLFAFVPIQGPSMENTISDGKKCFVQRTFFSVNRGDIITINTAEKNEDEHIIIKRVIGTAGDKLFFMLTENGKNVELYICRKGEINYTRLDEPYIKEKMIPDSLNKDHNVFSNSEAKIKIKISDYIAEIDRIDESTSDYIIKVPENSIFVLGDNRNVSRDSRYYGAFTLDKVMYKVLKII